MDLCFCNPAAMGRQGKSKEIMLQHFTWQQFLIAALIFTAIWYVVIALLLYRKELNDFINGKRKVETPPEPLKQVWEDEFEDELEQDENLVGKVPSGPRV